MKRTASNNSMSSQDRKRPATRSPLWDSPLRNSPSQQSLNSSSSDISVSSAYVAKFVNYIFESPFVASVPDNIPNSIEVLPQPIQQAQQQSTTYASNFASMPRNNSSDSLGRKPAARPRIKRSIPVRQQPQQNQFESDTLSLDWDSILDSVQNDIALQYQQLQQQTHTLNVASMPILAVVNAMPILDFQRIMNLVNQYKPNEPAAPEDKRELVYNPGTDVLIGEGNWIHATKANEKYRANAKYFCDSYSKIEKRKQMTQFTKGLTVYLINNHGYRFVKKEDQSDAVTFLTNAEARKKIRRLITNLKNPPKAS